MPRQFCYRIGFLSDTSGSFLALWNVNSFPVQRTFSTTKIRRISTSCGCWALLGRLYLFTPYALRWQSAFRNLIAYHGIGLLKKIKQVSTYIHKRYDLVGSLPFGYFYDLLLTFLLRLQFYQTLQ